MAQFVGHNNNNSIDNDNNRGVHVSNKEQERFQLKDNHQQHQQQPHHKSDRYPASRKISNVVETEFDAEEEEDNEDEDDVSSSSDSDDNSSDSDKDEYTANNENEEDEEEEDIEWEPILPHSGEVPVQIVSAATGAGIQQLWERLCGYALKDTNQNIQSAPSAVKEHIAARRMHSQQTLKNMQSTQQSMQGREARVFRGSVGGGNLSNGSASRITSANRNGTSFIPRPLIHTKNRRTVRARAREAQQEQEELLHSIRQNKAK